MIRLLSAISLSVLFVTAVQAQEAPEWAIALHGGAGVIERGDMTPERETEYRAALEDALRLGAGQLETGGSALDAIEVTIRALEDDPKFNSGKGAVFTAAGRNELDSSIMDGATLDAGAVAGVSHVRHPITLARLVMTDSPHVMLAGSGAEVFAEQAGAEMVEPAFFFTERRWQSLVRALEEKGLPIPARPEGVPPADEADEIDHAELDRLEREHRFGTVGVVALDRKGNIAAGTSTGGTNAKLWGRIGDSPIIGAGTYASNESCAVSGTGTGEYFIRLTLARSVCDHVKYEGQDIQMAADSVIHGDLEALHGDGGVVAMTPDGAVAFSFNTPGMYRGKMRAGEGPQVMIYGDEE